MAIAGKHSPGLLPLSFTKLFERMAHFGMQSLFFIYATHIIGMPTESTISFYSKYLLANALLPILGGLIGDLLLNVRIASLIGLGLEAAGCFVAAVPSIYGFYIGISLVALGSGLYTPNSIAMIAFMYRSKKKLMDAAITILFIGLNLGALISQSLLGYVADISSFSLAFGLCGFFALCAFLLLLLSYALQQEVPKRANIHTTEAHPSTFGAGWRVALLFTMALALGAYFIMMDTSVGMSSPKLYESAHSIPELPFPSYLLTLLNPLAYIFTGAVLGLLWSFFDVSPLIKIMAGFVVFALSMLPLALLHNTGSYSFLVFFALNGLLQGVSEMFISPVITSFICQHAPAKFLSTIIAACESVGYCFFAGYSYLLAFRERFSETLVLGSCGLASLLLAVLFLVFFLVLRNAGAGRQAVAADPPDPH